MIREALADAARVTHCSVTHTSTSNLIAGFKKTGIWPRDPTAVTKECVLGDNYKRELDKRRAAAAMPRMAAGPAAAAGGAGDAAGGAGRSADGGDDDDDSDDDARGDDVAGPATAPPLDPAAKINNEILVASGDLLATWDTLFSKPEAAVSRFRSGSRPTAPRSPQPGRRRAQRRSSRPRRRSGGDRQR